MCLSKKSEAKPFLHRPSRCLWPCPGRRPSLPGAELHSRARSSSLWSGGERSRWSQGSLRAWAQEGAVWWAARWWLEAAARWCAPSLYSSARDVVSSFLLTRFSGVCILGACGKRTIDRCGGRARPMPLAPGAGRALLLSLVAPGRGGRLSCCRRRGRARGRAQPYL